MTERRGSEWNQWDLHVHTASSYDAYHGDDSDTLLAQAWKDNKLSAVAVTDHFKIDSDRINKLKRLVGDNLVIFPGVELRTDKGASNIHVIIIFPEDSDLEKLSNSFDAIMIDSKAKSKDSSETIYWDFNDIVDFCNNHNGLLSIHTGSKDKGLDKEITNALPVNMAIKEEFASQIHFFELGKEKDVHDYNKHVLPKVGPKPLIICSDNHDPRDYKRKEKLWIKADVTFDGLIQAINHPEERVFIGDVPKKIDKANKNKSVYIDSIQVKRKNEAKNKESSWFNFDIPLNNGLSIIIGNKGSGKSAFADILGHLCDSNSMSEASFLTESRFSKPPHKYSEDYTGVVKWLDGKISKKENLDQSGHYTDVQYARYLPQKFIERICTDLGEEFQQEINKVLFSYIDNTEKVNAISLEDLIYKKSFPNINKIKDIQEEIKEINKETVNIEHRLTSQYKQSIIDNFNKCENDLERHDNNKPPAVDKPKNSFNDEDKKFLEGSDIKINELDQNIERYKNKLTEINGSIDTLNNAQADIDTLESSINELNLNLQKIQEKNFLNDEEYIIKYTTPKEKITNKIQELKNSRNQLRLLLDDSDDPVDKSLYKQLKDVTEARKRIIDKSDTKEKTYQKYLEDMKEWNLKRRKIIGSENDTESLTYYKVEFKKINEVYPEYYCELKRKREDKIKEVYNQNILISKIYSQVYKPIDQELINLLNHIDEKVEFSVNLVNSDNELSSNILKYVNHSFSGVFNGKDNAYVKLKRFIKETDFSNIESILEFTEKVFAVVSESLDKSSDIIKNKEEFYNQLFCLNYLGVEFNLNYSGKGLLELSPGERGIVLLIFYLALNKGQEPLVIDQPEDNLDNESVFTQLVPCIIEAKKRRQVVIVTHNPNIAIACDAEQVIHCKIDKYKNEISYTSGSIEDKEIRQSIINVLEGTRPAFSLRRKKYLFS